MLRAEQAGTAPMAHTPTLDLPSTHWRMRAEEARTLAERTHDDRAMRSWLVVAENYEFLARQAEERERFEQKLAAKAKTTQQTPRSKRAG